jgi:predicted RNase H-like HicB family nuclease
MAKPKNKYLVQFERDDDGRWVATVPRVPGCFTQGRTIEQARERVREALQAWFDLPKPYAGTIADDVRFPAAVQRAVRTANDARQRALEAAAEASRATREALTAVADLGLSLRDAGAVVGMTRQRAQQLVAAPARRAAAARARPPSARRVDAARKTVG